MKNIKEDNILGITRQDIEIYIRAKRNGANTISEIREACFYKLDKNICEIIKLNIKWMSKQLGVENEF